MTGICFQFNVITILVYTRNEECHILALVRNIARHTRTHTYLFMAIVVPPTCCLTTPLQTKAEEGKREREIKKKPNPGRISKSDFGFVVDGVGALAVPCRLMYVTDGFFLPNQALHEAPIFKYVHIYGHIHPNIASSASSRPISPPDAVRR